MNQYRIASDRQPVLHCGRTFNVRQISTKINDVFQLHVNLMRLAIMLTQWKPWVSFSATKRTHLGIIVDNNTRSVFLTSDLLCDIVSVAVITQSPVSKISVRFWTIIYFFWTDRQQMPRWPVPGCGPVIADPCNGFRRYPQSWIWRVDVYHSRYSKQSKHLLINFANTSS